MLTIKETPRLTGVYISGDYWDFDQLLTSIYTLIGDENRYYDYAGPRARIHKVCSSMKYAMTGAETIEQVANGVSKSVSKRHGQIFSDKNIYFKVNVLLPEIIFLALALNDFVVLHKETVDDSDWNVHVTTVRQFQALIAACIEPFIEEQHFLVFLTTLHKKSPLFYRYASQYIDLLNIEYLNTPITDREREITNMALRLLADDEPYQILKKKLLAVSSINKYALHEIPINFSYPEEIFW